MLPIATQLQQVDWVDGGGGFFQEEALACAEKVQGEIVVLTWNQVCKLTISPLTAGVGVMIYR
jgi:hypothetical protein